MTRLYIMNGPDKGRSFDLEGGTIYIGRSPGNDIQLKDKSVSRKHLKIIGRGDKYFVEDLQSKNGTFINGNQISPGDEFEVRQGLPVAIGSIVVSLGEEYSGDDVAVPDSVDLSEELSEDELAILESTDLSEELSEADLATLDSFGVSEELAETATDFAKDRPMTPQRNMELIYRVSNLLMQSLSMDDNITEIFEKIMNYILDLLKRVDRGVFILLDSETGEISELIPILKKSTGDTLEVYSRTIVDRVLREGKAVIMLDTHTEDEADLSESLRLMRIRSVMCVPLISKSEIRGVIYVDSVSKPHGFRREDLSLLTALSIPAALAIENASLKDKS
ncbi:MAG: FHA domain-containing protein [Desulfobacterales bacterium]|nr:FHA domain-containing protein [Desulfobacterales bacterium]